MRFSPRQRALCWTECCPIAHLPRPSTSEPSPRTSSGSRARSRPASLAALLLHPLGRRLIAGLASDWPQAGLPELRKALQGLRDSSFVLEQQAFHALRDLTNGAYFADPATWPAIGYPGPQPI